MISIDQKTWATWFLLDFNPLAVEVDIYSLAHHLCKMWTFYEPRINISKYKTFCGGINEDGERKLKKN